MKQLIDSKAAEAGYPALLCKGLIIALFSVCLFGCNADSDFEAPQPGSQAPDPDPIPDPDPEPEPDPDPEPDPEPASEENIRSAVFLDDVVGGVQYTTATLGQDESLFSDAQGRMQYRAGENIQLSIGDLLFPLISGQQTITPRELADADVNDTAVINMVRLLLSLDADGNADNGIEVPANAADFAYALNFSADFDNFAVSAQPFVTNVTGRTLVSPFEALRHLQRTVDEQVDRRTTVVADGAGGSSARSLIETAFGENTIEDQDCAASPSQGETRITEVNDGELNKPVFEFNIQMDDVDCSTESSDRQRLEIKTFADSPDYLVSTEGEWHSFRWKFRLDSGFQASSNFSHIFQVKAAGGDDSQPLVTLTARKGSPDTLQLIHVSGSEDGSEASLLADVDLDDVRGTWVDASVRIHSSDEGYVEVTLKDYLSGETLLSYTNNAIDMYRTGADFNRPKWGIYRSIVNAQDLRAEAIRFADFCVAEANNTCPLDEFASTMGVVYYGFEDGTPGAAPSEPFSSADAQITTEQARGGSQSVKLFDTLGDNNGKLRISAEPTTTGSFRASIWLPDDVDVATALTVFSGGNSSSSNKVAEAILTASGDLRVRAPSGSQDTVGEVATSRWYDFELAWADIENSKEFVLFVDGELIGTYPVVLEGLVPDRIEIKFGTTSELSVTGVLIDDVLAFAPCLSCVVEDDGDDEDPEEPPVEQAQFDFEAETLGMAPGGDFVSAEALVSDEQAHSGSLSVKIGDTSTSDNGKLRLTDASVGAAGSLKASIYVPGDADVVTYLSIYSGGFSSGSNKVGELILTNSGSVRYRAAGNEQITVDDYSLDAWHNYEIKWSGADTSGSYQFLMDGVVVIDNIDSLLPGLVPDRFEVKYGTGSATSVSAVYVDDITFSAAE